MVKASRLRAIQAVLILLAFAGCGNPDHANEGPRATLTPLFVNMVIGGVFWIVVILFVRRLWRRTAVRSSDPKAPRSEPRARDLRVDVELQRKERRVRVATEVVKVPVGVSIAVKRTRTVEHIVEVSTDERFASQMDGQLLSVLKASVRGEIERKLGRSYKESTITEYEVKLNGEKANQYKLVWVDVWILGQAHTEKKGPVPFQFRDRAELEVVPVALT